MLNNPLPLVITITQQAHDELSMILENDELTLEEQIEEVQNLAFELERALRTVDNKYRELIEVRQC